MDQPSPDPPLDLFSRVSHGRTADEVVRQVELLILEGILRGARNQEAQGIKPSQGPGIFGTPIPEKKDKGGL